MSVTPSLMDQRGKAIFLAGQYAGPRISQVLIMDTIDDLHLSSAND
jgi:hypothetical protein